MNKLRTRFGLALSFVLLTATLLPILIFYLLGASGLVEVTYVAEAGETRQTREMIELPIATPPALPDLTPAPWTIDTQFDDRLTSIDRIDPVTGERIPMLIYDSQLEQWVLDLPTDMSRVILSSPVVKFRVDLPAWLVIGSLPLFSLLIGIVLSIWMSRSVTQPVSQLSQAVHAVGRRELGYRVETQGSQELQALAQSFNQMAGELERAELTRRNLMADIAHELRTPLSVLEGNLRAMLDGVHKTDEEEIALLYEQTQHLKHLVEDLRVLSLAEADQLALNCQPVDLAQLLKDTLAHFEFIAEERGIQLRTEIPESLIHPSLDEIRMRQVLHNLLSNALRYTPQAGMVTVSAKILPENNAIEILVADTGAGITPEELPYIFDRFNRTRGRHDRDGTGLGLAIAKAFVEAQGGSVTAQSGGIDLGSTFTIRLPI
jgi:signal transduction histidine kinase